MIGASPQAVVAFAALRGVRHDHTVADLDALDHRSDGFDDADAAVAQDGRLGKRAGAGCGQVRSQRAAGV